MTLPLFILNGPNLNLLGTREPQVYGAATLQDLEALASTRAASHGRTVDFRQSNHEGVLVDWLHEAHTKACAVILNSGAYTHTSIALHDAIRAIATPVIELHLSNIHAREPFRHQSYVAPAARGIIMGFGPLGYALAVDAACALVSAG